MLTHYLISRLTSIARILSVLLMLFSLTMVPPIVVGFIYQDGGIPAFISGFAYTFLAGGLLWLVVRNRRAELKTRDGFFVVVLFWTVLSLFGAVPLMLMADSMSFTNAAFESISGLTTTGATVITGIDHLPHAILYYRQQLQWLGGMGIVVLAVAVLPMLGVGGMQLYRAETPGPIKDNKLTPRITETAKALWQIYVTLTLICIFAYAMAGMDWFDAICHGFSTISIGGFSTHDASFAFFNTPAIEIVCVVFMILAGINFSVHFTAFYRLKLSNYWQDSEVKLYFYILAITVLICFITLSATHHYAEYTLSLRHGLFQAVSMATTSGFVTEPFSTWPVFLPVMLILTSGIGCCAGSTGGGIKVIRWMLLVKQGYREIKRLIHPNAVFPIRIGSKTLPNRVVEAVWGFFAVYVMVFVLLMLALIATGLDQVSAFSAVAACLNNLGPGLGQVAENYHNISSAGKWLLCLAMLLGRLEIFTLLVLFTPAFWRR